MDQHGPDAPEGRQYLPTLADLMDRLTIVMLKRVYISEHAEHYYAEQRTIQHDIDVLLDGKTTDNPSDYFFAVSLLMLSNRVIWENESKARAGGSEQDKLLKFTHSINGVRNRAKNMIAQIMGERLDHKVDSLAADLPPEFGNWDIL